MKMSFCKVHLGMLQYCLNISQLLNSSLIKLKYGGEPCMFFMKKLSTVHLERSRVLAKKKKRIFKNVFPCDFFSLYFCPRHSIALHKRAFLFVLGYSQNFDEK